MSSNYPEGSMRGSGIYSLEVSYEDFVCENEECEKPNEAGETATNDWGNYRVECEFCGSLYLESSLEQDRDDYYADQDREDY